MSEWVTQLEAAELLGVHKSRIGKLVTRGALTPRNGRPSLPRAQVVEFAAVRAAVAVERELRRTTRPAAGPRPPDGEHEWLRAPAAAAVIGCTVIAIGGRAARGQVPCVVHDGRRWFRLDLLELQVRAAAARERGRVQRV